MPDPVATLMAALEPTRPSIGDLDTLLANDERTRRLVPIENERLAAPFEFQELEGVVHAATFEIYDASSPLFRVSTAAYRAFMKRPEAATTRNLVLGNVACKEFDNTQLLGDPIRLLAREGLPPNLERLQFERIGPVTNAGDLGYYETTRLSPILSKLGNLKELRIARCESVGKLDLPNLRVLSIHSDVSIKNLKELAKAQLPALERLELGCDIFSHVERRFKAARALLRSKRLPRLSHLVLEELDLDEDGWLELDDDEDVEGEPDSWVDMIADSPVLRQLQTLDVSFRDADRELPTLVARAQAFGHLGSLEFWGARGRTHLAFPTREVLREALT